MQGGLKGRMKQLSQTGDAGRTVQFSDQDYITHALQSQFTKIPKEEVPEEGGPPVVQAKGMR